MLKLHSFLHMIPGVNKIQIHPNPVSNLLSIIISISYGPYDIPQDPYRIQIMNNRESTDHGIKITSSFANICAIESSQILFLFKVSKQVAAIRLFIFYFELFQMKNLYSNFNIQYVPYTAAKTILAEFHLQSRIHPHQDQRL